MNWDLAEEFWLRSLKNVTFQSKAVALAYQIAKHTHTYSYFMTVTLRHCSCLSLSAAFIFHSISDLLRQMVHESKVCVSSCVTLLSLLLGSGPCKNANTNLHELHPHQLCTMTLHVSAP